MSTEQISVRIPKELVEFLDDHVRPKPGKDPAARRAYRSRAAFLTAVLAKLQREERDQRDAAIYQGLGEDDRAEDRALGEWGAINAARVWADLD